MRSGCSCLPTSPAHPTVKTTLPRRRTRQDASDPLERSSMTDPPRAITWTGTAIQIIDQTVLPTQLKVLIINKIDDLVSAIARLAVRGAPALGAVGGLGVVLALAQAQREGWSQAATLAAIERLRQA